MTPKADVWQLGMLLDCMITLRGTASPAYSERVMELRTMMLKPNPRERPDAVDVVHHIMEREGLRGGLASDGTGSRAGGHEQTRGFFSGFFERLSKYINKTGTRYACRCANIR